MLHLDDNRSSDWCAGQYINDDICKFWHGLFLIITQNECAISQWLIGHKNVPSSSLYFAILSLNQPATASQITLNLSPVGRKNSQQNKREFPPKKIILAKQRYICGFDTAVWTIDNAGCNDIFQYDTLIPAKALNLHFSLCW